MIVYDNLPCKMYPSWEEFVILREIHIKWEDIIT